MRWILLENRTTDGSGDGFSIPSIDGVRDLFLRVSGTFDGATVVLEKSVDGGSTWFTHGEGSGTPASWTAAVDTTIRAQKARYRGTVSHAGASTSVSMEIFE